MTGAHRRRAPGPAARLLAVALLLAGCGPTVEPITSFAPSPTRPPATAIPSTGRFVKTAYPADGEAPCGQAAAPDAAHAAYSGNLRRISATDALTVVFELCQPDVAFRAKVAAPAFAINDAAWLRTHIDPATSGPQAIVREVNGTGPYRLESWDLGSEVSFARNDGYWGDAARNERAIVRWLADPAGRLAELQNATVDGADQLSTAGIASVTDDVGLALGNRPGLDVFYVGFNNTFSPFGDERVRRAVAMGIDRKHIVESFFPPGSEVASSFTPCAIPHGCAGAPWYEYDPLLAKELLTTAGYPDGFDTKIHYREASTSYLPDSTAVATELKAELLANLGIRADLVTEPEGTFVGDVYAGKLDGIHLRGQEATFPDVTEFLDPNVGPGASAEFGKPFSDIGKALVSGRATVDDGKREVSYAKANNAIRTHIPMIPVARIATAAAFRADVTGAAASPLHLERFASMMPGDRRQFVWLTTAEPAGLYCADETDPVSSLVCAQMMEGLYAYDPSGASTVPALAQRCDPNPELTVWTCKLRKGVTFHDGSVLDANDVVLSFAVQWDAEHPLHRGRDGTFRTFASWFGGFLNAPAVPGG
ncbi:MAG: ABC transporter substrate-binding protein [Chloroflexota bacterium]